MHDLLIVISDDLNDLNNWDPYDDEILRSELCQATEGAFDWLDVPKDGNRERLMKDAARYITENFGTLIDDNSFMYDREKIERYLHYRYFAKQRWYAKMASLSEDEFYHYSNRIGETAGDESCLVYAVGEWEQGMVHIEDKVLYGENTVKETLDNLESNGFFDTDHYFTVIDYHS